MTKIIDNTLASTQGGPPTGPVWWMFWPKGKTKTSENIYFAKAQTAYKAGQEAGLNFKTHHSNLECELVADEETIRQLDQMEKKHAEGEAAEPKTGRKGKAKVSRAGKGNRKGAGRKATARKR